MKIFGRSYEEVGKSTSDFMIVTKGQVKVKWGNKFIDLIKDGKVNAEVESIINKVTSKDDIPNKDGIYITEDNEVYIMSGGILIPVIKSSDDSEYVSYIIQKNKTAEERENAQRNICLTCDTMSDAQASGIQNGLVYVINDSNLYLVKNGVYTTLKIDIPNPFTSPIVVKLSGNHDYALYLEGYFSENGTGLVIGGTDNGLHIYCESDGTYIDSTSSINIKVNGSNVVSISDTTINSDLNIELKDGKHIQCNIFKTIDGSKDCGTYIEKGDIYCDNIYVRNKIMIGEVLTYMELRQKMASNNLVKGNTYFISDYQNPWNIYEQIEEDVVEDSEGEETTDDEGDVDIDNITRRKILKHKNVFQLEVYAISDSMISRCAKMTDYPNIDILYDVLYDNVVCTEQDESGQFEISAKGLIYRMVDSGRISAPFDFINARFNIYNDGKMYFPFGGEYDMSQEGKYENIMIHGKFEDFRFESEPNDDNVSYVINSNAKSMFLFKKEASDVSIDISNCKLVINSELFEHNSIKGFDNGGNVFEINRNMSYSNLVLPTISGLSINTNLSNVNIYAYSKSNNISINYGNNISIKGNSIDGLKINCSKLSASDINIDTINNLELNGSFENITIHSNKVSNMVLNGTYKEFVSYSNTIENLTMNGEYDSFIIHSDFLNVSLSGANNAKIEGDFKNISFSKKLVGCTFHSDFDGVNFDDIENNEFLYDSLKYADVYYNKDRVVIVCIPDLASALFVGEIRMYSGDMSKLPFGWHLCDGNNGTPNLIGKFIKAASTSGGSGGNKNDKEYQFTISNKQIPIHEHGANIESSDISLKSNWSMTGTNLGNKMGVLMCKYQAALDGTPSNGNVRTGVYDRGGDENHAIYAGVRGNEYDYRWKSPYELFNEMSVTASGGNITATITTPQYTQEPVKIKISEFIPEYYELAFIMYTGK